MIRLPLSSDNKMVKEDNVKGGTIKKWNLEDLQNEGWRIRYEQQCKIQLVKKDN